MYSHQHPRSVQQQVILVKFVPIEKLDPLQSSLSGWVRYLLRLSTAIWASARKDPHLKSLIALASDRTSPHTSNCSLWSRIFRCLLDFVSIYLETFVGGWRLRGIGEASCPLPVWKCRFFSQPIRLSAWQEIGCCSSLPRLFLVRPWT